jgi:hypothetical protein
MTRSQKRASKSKARLVVNPDIQEPLPRRRNVLTKTHPSLIFKPSTRSKKCCLFKKKNGANVRDDTPPSGPSDTIIPGELPVQEIERKYKQLQDEFNALSIKANQVKAFTRHYQWLHQFEHVRNEALQQQLTGRVTVGQPHSYQEVQVAVQTHSRDVGAPAAIYPLPTIQVNGLEINHDVLGHLQPGQISPRPQIPQNNAPVELPAVCAPVIPVKGMQIPTIRARVYELSASSSQQALRRVSLRLGAVRHELSVTSSHEVLRSPNPGHDTARSQVQAGEHRAGSSGRPSMRSGEMLYQLPELAPSQADFSDIFEGHLRLDGQVVSVPSMSPASSAGEELDISEDEDGGVIGRAM